MAENGLSERVERIENKLDGLSGSVGQRFREVDSQFFEVREHFGEQRRYIEFAHDKLDKRMTAGFSRLDQRVDDLDKRTTEGFSRLERKLDQVIDSRSRPVAAPRRPARPSKRRR